MDRELFRELHEEEYRRQEVDDRNALEYEALIAQAYCYNCEYERGGICMNIESGDFGKRVAKRNYCDEWHWIEED